MTNIYLKHFENDRNAITLLLKRISFKNFNFETNHLKKYIFILIIAKRKRGKLNLEKAMSKNMFEEPKNQNIFDSLQFKNMHHNENDINLLKKSYQQSVINATLDTNTSKTAADSQSLTQIQETSSGRSKSKVQINDPHENAPAMFKIALKIKRLTEEKILKKTPSEESRNSITELEPSQDLKSCLKTKQQVDEIKLELSEEDLLEDEIVEFELQTENTQGKISIKNYLRL